MEKCHAAPTPALSKRAVGSISCYIAFGCDAFISRVPLRRNQPAASSPPEQAEQCLAQSGRTVCIGLLATFLHDAPCACALLVPCTPGFLRQYLCFCQPSHACLPYTACISHTVYCTRQSASYLMTQRPTCQAGLARVLLGRAFDPAVTCNRSCRLPAKI